MNPRETLKKMAEAIGVVIEPQEQEVQEVAEATDAVVETEQEVQQVEEAVAEPTEAVENAETEEAEEPKEESEPEAEEPKEEAQVEEVKAEEPVDNGSDRVAELERQLNDLKEILKNAMAEPVKEEAEVVPEIPEEEPKGLTHSPEAEVAKRQPKIAAQGNSIQSTVYRYMNNK